MARKSMNRLKNYMHQLIGWYTYLSEIIQMTGIRLRKFLRLYQHSSVECSQIAVKIHKGKTIIFLPKTNCIKEIKYSKNSPHMEVCWIEDREE